MNNKNSNSNKFKGGDFMKNKFFIDESKGKVFLNGDEIEGVYNVEIKIKYTPEERVLIKTAVVEIEFKDLEILGNECSGD